jgi:hypothetical protein
MHGTTNIKFTWFAVTIKKRLMNIEAAPCNRSRWLTLCICFVAKSILYSERVVSTSPKPQAGWPPLVGCPRLILYVPPSATQEPAVPWWQGPTYRDSGWLGFVIFVMNCAQLWCPLSTECSEGVNCTALCRTPMCSRPWTVACGKFTGAFTDINTQCLTTSLTSLNQEASDFYANMYVVLIVCK